MLFSEAIKQKSQCQVWDTSLLFVGLGVGKFKRTLKTIQVTTTILGCLPELDGKTILLKMLSSLLLDMEKSS